MNPPVPQKQLPAVYSTKVITESSLTHLTVTQINKRRLPFFIKMVYLPKNILTNTSRKRIIYSWAIVRVVSVLVVLYTPRQLLP